jgi:hypothetical protein
MRRRRQRREDNMGKNLKFSSKAVENATKGLDKDKCRA